MPKISLSTILDCTGGRQVGEQTMLKTPLPVVHDTRQISGPCIYAAVKGERFDGHDFLQRARKKGARACIVSDAEQAGKFSGPAVIVKDTVRALGDIAGHIRRSSSIPWIGITGSSGKTTTREILSSILRQEGKVLVPEKNYNNLIGLPLTVLRLDPAHKYAVLELGTNAPGEIRRLSDIARPDIAMIVSTGAAHTQYLKNEEGVAEEKSQILRKLDTKNKAILNRNDRFLKKYRSCTRAAVRTFGLDTGDYFAAQVVQHPDHVSFKLNNQIECRVQGTGLHLAVNACAAIAAAQELDISITKCISGIFEFKPVDHRMFRSTVNGVHVLDDTYNSNPVSLQNALMTLLSFSGGKKIVVLGDMLELGDLSGPKHREAVRWLNDTGIDRAFLFGKEIEKAWKKSRPGKTNKIVCCSSEKELISQLVDVTEKGDHILFKASRGMRFDALSEKTKKRLEKRCFTTCLI